jgi:hypothetical protein
MLLGTRTYNSNVQSSKRNHGKVGRDKVATELICKLSVSGAVLTYGLGNFIFLVVCLLHVSH